MIKWKSGFYCSHLTNRSQTIPIEIDLLWQVGNVSVSCTKMPLLALEYEEPRSKAILLMFFLVLYFDIIHLSSTNTSIVVVYSL